MKTQLMPTPQNAQLKTRHQPPPSEVSTQLLLILTTCLILMPLRAGSPGRLLARHRPGACPGQRPVLLLPLFLVKLMLLLVGSLLPGAAAALPLMFLVHTMWWNS